mgnify:CR=1 FL=1
MLFGVCYGCKYICGVILLSQGAGWTYGDTLTAGYAGGLSQAHLKGRADGSGKSAVVGADNADALYVFADSHTAAAQDTFAVVPNHMGGRGVNLRRGNLSVIVTLVVNAQLMGQLLKLAVSAADTGQTGTVVVG